MKKVYLGVVSFLPNKTYDRSMRQARLDELLIKLRAVSNLPILIIAQNWQDYLPSISGITVYQYDIGLGIAAARAKLRDAFLETDGDYLIMLDDDLILEFTKNDFTEYINEILRHPNGFCFPRQSNFANMYPNDHYIDACLNLNVVSRYIYEQTPMVNAEASLGQCWEDKLFLKLVTKKYSELEFIMPKTIKFRKDPPEAKKCLPSTWVGKVMFDINKVNIMRKNYAYICNEIDRVGYLGKLVWKGTTPTIYYNE